MLRGRSRPGSWGLEVELLAMAARAAHRLRGWMFRVGIKATVRMQPHEQLSPASFEPSLQLDGIVAGVEDEPGCVAVPRQPTEQRFRLLDGDLVGIIFRLHAPSIDREHSEHGLGRRREAKMGRKVPFWCSVRLHRRLLRPFSDRFIGGLLEWDMWARIDRSRLARSHKYASIRPQIGLPRFPIGPPPIPNRTSSPTSTNHRYR
jgi:hypothetical protein